MAENSKATKETEGKESIPPRKNRGKRSGSQKKAKGSTRSGRVRGNVQILLVSGLQITSPPAGTSPPPPQSNAFNFTGTPLQANLSGSYSSAATMLSYSIDGGAQINIPLPDQSGDPPYYFNATMSGDNCNPTNAPHCVTVFAWDNTGPATVARGFFRGT
jgi:hypothetical protein